MDPVASGINRLVLIRTSPKRASFVLCKDFCAAARWYKGVSRLSSPKHFRHIKLTLPRVAKYVGSPLVLITRSKLTTNVRQTYELMLMTDVGLDDSSSPSQMSS